jgi:hypothetical protein
MPKVVRSSKRPVQGYVVVGAKGKFRGALPDGVTVCKTANLKTWLHGVLGQTVFVSCRRTSTDALLKARLRDQKPHRFDRLLTMETPHSSSVPALQGMFAQVIGVGGYRWLHVEELVTVIAGKNAGDRFIGGAADPQSRTLVLVRGNYQIVVVPFSSFRETSDGTKPDFGALSFTDYGHTVVLGEYEAATDAILYEHDEEFRRRLNKQRQKSEKSFGASLRRLRIQRRLRREDFPPLAAKTIARIERNEIGKPHGKSLDTIAQRLGVPADQIETY